MCLPFFCFPRSNASHTFDPASSATVSLLRIVWSQLRRFYQPNHNIATIFIHDFRRIVFSKTLNLFVHDHSTLNTCQIRTRSRISSKILSSNHDFPENISIWLVLSLSPKWLTYFSSSSKTVLRESRSSTRVDFLQKFSNFLPLKKRRKLNSPTDAGNW